VSLTAIKESITKDKTKRLHRSCVNTATAFSPGHKGVKIKSYCCYAKR